MIFKLQKDAKSIERLRQVKLSDISWREIDLQDLVFKNIFSIFPEDNLFLFSYSRNWQEEPDLMALDENGVLFIFELKRWESEHNNLLQVMRYGQIFGTKDYHSLNKYFKSLTKGTEELVQGWNTHFGHIKGIECINKEQRFVVMTNGIDVNTRNAIEFWKDKGVSIEPWVYRLFKLADDILIEFDRFSANDAVIEEFDDNFYILNTNLKEGPEDEANMLKHKKAAAYFSPWKDKIDRIAKKGCRVLLYSSGRGIVAAGESKGVLKECAYRDNQEFINEEKYVELENFKVLTEPMSASEVNKLLNTTHKFRQTLFGISREQGELIWNEILKRSI